MDVAVRSMGLSWGYNGAVHGLIRGPNVLSHSRFGEMYAAGNDSKEKSAPVAHQTADGCPPRPYSARAPLSITVPLV